MPNTVGELERLITHTLGGDTVPTELGGTVAVVREAGAIWEGMRVWNCLKRPPVPLSMVLDQDWLDLPADFGSVLSLQFADGLSGSFVESTPKEVGTLATTPQLQGPLTYYWWLAHEGSAALNPPTPRIQLHQASPSNAADVAILTYRAGFTMVSNDDDVVVVPDWCLPLFRQIVIAVARGYVEEDVKSLDERVTELASGALFRSAAKRDALMQPNLGQLAGGAASTAYASTLFNPDKTVGLPVTY